MTSDLVIYLSKQTLMTGALISAPILIAASITGLLVSIFQVVTQIQDSTLTFIPKIIVVALTVGLFGSWMLSKLIHFSETLINHIPSYLQ